MALPEPPYISLQEAASTILQCSLDRIRFYIAEGFLFAYARTPIFLPTPKKYPGLSEQDIFTSPNLTMFWTQPLADHCRIKLPITWHDGQVECHTIIVTEVSGAEPSPSGITLSKYEGRIDQGGEIYWCRGWSFHENSIMLSTEEVKCFEAKHRQKAPASTFAMRKPPVSVKSRNDALKKILLQIVYDFRKENNRSPQYREVLSSLKRIAKNGRHPVLQEVKDDKISWISERGVEKITSIKQLQNRLTNINTAQN